MICEKPRQLEKEEDDILSMEQHKTKKIKRACCIMIAVVALLILKIRFLAFDVILAVKRGQESVKDQHHLFANLFTPPPLSLILVLKCFQVRRVV